MKFNRFTFGKDFIFKNNQIHLNDSGFKKVKKLKKLTGSRIGAVFGNDAFRTPFQLWCEMFGFFEKEENTFFLDAGNVIEPKLREYAEKQTGKKFVYYDSQEVGYDLFKEEQIFGGIPDGEEKNSSGNTVSILEIKTAQLDKYKWSFKDNQIHLVLNDDGKPEIVTRGGNLCKWFKNGQVLIPKNYQDQLSLYLYLRGVDTGYFCVAFLSKKDYLDPDKVVFKSKFNNYRGYDLDTVPNLSADDHLLVWQEFKLNRKEFAKKIEEATRWYMNFIKTGISPKLTQEDLTWFRFGYPNLVQC